MIFEELSRLRQRSVMTSIVLMAAGFLMILCPAAYIPSAVSAVGFAMLVAAVVMFLDFISSKKALIDYICFTLALIIGIAAFVILIFQLDTVYVLSFLFGVFLILDGIYSVFNALIYARRSGRRGWWVLLVLSALQIAAGAVIFADPWWQSPESLLRVIGITTLFAALISILRLIWNWPIRST